MPQSKLKKNQNKTRENDGDVLAFIDAVPHEGRRQDALVLLDIFRDITGHPPRMWGASIIGFDKYAYQTAAGRSGEWCLTGFSPRKANLTLYIMDGFIGHENLLNDLGKYKCAKSCLYINKLADVDLDILRKLIENSIDVMRGRYHIPDQT